MIPSYSYDKATILLEQPRTFSVATPGLKKTSAYFYAPKSDSAAAESQILEVDLENRSINKICSISEDYEKNLAYDPTNNTIYSLRDGILTAHNQDNEKITQLRIYPQGSDEALPDAFFKLKILGKILVIITKAHICLIETINLKFTKLAIGIPGYEYTDFVHAGGDVVAALGVEQSEKVQGVVNLFDILNESLITSFKIGFKPEGRAKLFYNYESGLGVVFRGVESSGEDKIVGMTTFDSKNETCDNQAFKIKSKPGDKVLDMAYCYFSHSVYLLSDQGSLVQIGLEESGFVGGLGVYEGATELESHPLWPGVIILFEKGVEKEEELKVGFLFEKRDNK